MISHPVTDLNCRFKSTSSAGFTLIEVLVVLTILAAVLTGFSVGMAKRDNTPSPRQTAKEIQALVYRARSDAIASGIGKTVLIDTKKHLFIYGDMAPVYVPESQEMKLSVGLEFTAAGGEALLLFLADGSSTGADISLSDQHLRKAKLRINWLTGLPSVLEGEEK